MKATGEFEVSLEPLDCTTVGSDGNVIARMSIDKKFSGDLTGVSKGEMLSVMTAVNGSAGYVAVEQVSGSLDGKSGSFVLQHAGTMAGGSDSLVVDVVPDSGTEDLVGLTGKLSINIDDGKHFYKFDYEITT